jgi:hypothetical protein
MEEVRLTPISMISFTSQHKKALFSIPKNQKLFKILRYIEFYGTYMEH